MGLARQIMNFSNVLAGKFGLRLGSLAEWESNSLTGMSGLLFENATKIGSSGARNAFVSYLLACPVAQSEAQKWLGQLLNDDLQGLADEVCTVSSMGSTALDQFMRFYAENWSVSCSQWSQDVFVWYSLGKEFRGGRYLEIGGADGVTHSNTLMLQQALGWSGVLVEPHPGQCRLLRFNRGRHNTVLNLAAGSAGAVGYVDLIDAGQFSRPERLDVDDMHAGFLREVSGRVRAPLRGFDEILLEAGPLDYLSLDVEGGEVELLAAIPWGRIEPPSVITVEHNGRENDIDRYRQILTTKGYTECCCRAGWLTRGDLWFVSPGKARVL
jgi:FkbM family methyltransferase